MSKILFSIFIINTCSWIFKLVSPRYAAFIRLKIATTLGIYLYLGLCVFRYFFNSYIIFLSSDYLFFSIFYYHISLLGFFLSGIILLLTIDKAYTSQTPKIFSNWIEKEFDISKNRVTKKSQEFIFCTLIYNIALAIAWSKSHKYIESSGIAKYENQIITSLYIFTFVVIVFLTFSILKKHITKSFQQKH